MVAATGMMHEKMHQWTGQQYQQVHVRRHAEPMLDEEQAGQRQTGGIDTKDEPAGQDHGETPFFPAVWETEKTFVLIRLKGRRGQAC